MRLLALLTVFVLLAPLALASEWEDVGVTLISQSPDPIEPGDSVDLRFRFENNGSATVGGIEVEFLPKHPFTISESPVRGIGSIDAKQKAADAVVVKYTVAVDSDADEGLHEVFLRYRIGGSAWIRVGPFLVDVDSSDAVLGVESVSSEPLPAGGTGNVTVALRNFGKSGLRDVRATLVIDDTVFSPAGVSNEQVFRTLAAGEAADANFSFFVDADAASRRYNTVLRMVYLDDSNRQHVRNATLGLLVYNEPALSLSLKETDVYTSGSHGDIVLSISNIGPSDVRFMTVELLDSAVYDVISSPSVYVGNLEPDDFETAEFTIRLDSGSDVPLGVRLSYSDSFNREIVKSETVTLPVYSSSEARSLGLTTAGTNFLAAYLVFGAVLIAVVFVAFMLVDCLKNSLPRYKKALWIAVILTGTGAVIYYFIARRKK